MTFADPADPAAADPMMRVLRERHPDVTIVLLPPIEPLRDEPSATAAQCRALQRHAASVLATLGASLGRSPSTQVAHWWSQAHPDVRRWVSAVSFDGLDEGEPLALLRSVGNELVRLGWDPRPAADGSPRVRGIAGPFELIATASSDAVSVRLTSDPLHVPAALHDELGAGA